jgi:glycosyltransferase involved in cell wall biosynthesis
MIKPHPQVKAAIVHPQLCSGGSEARALWGIEALRRDFDVTLITGGIVDLDRLNAYYGTRLDPKEFSIRTVNMPFGLHRSSKFAGLRGAFLQRYLRRVSGQFDVMVSAYNACDFGRPGIQFIADFSFVSEWRQKLDPAVAGHRDWWYGDSPLRRAYLGLCRQVSPSDPAAWKQNLTVANSDWSGQLLQREFGIESRTVYPAVTAEFPSVRWEHKENGFVCIGRVVPEKRMDAVIRILEKVREAGHDIHLHILGGLDDSPFGAKLKELAAPRNWVYLEGRIFGQKKKDLIVGHRFGINGRENEPFGIAPAELVKAGAITFVPASGGQQEIVNHPMLTFENEDDAARKVCTVLSSASLQENLREHLSGQAAKFSVESFMAGFRQVVLEFLNQPVPQKVNYGEV